MKKNEALYRLYVRRVFVERDLNAWDEMAHEDYRVTDPDFDRGSDRASARSALQSILDGFSDITYDVIQCVCEDDWIAARWVFEGDHSGTYVGIASSGQRIRMSGMSFNRLRDGKFIEGHVISDFHNAMKQMLPSRG